MSLWEIINRIFGLLVIYFSVRFFLHHVKQNMLKTDKGFLKSIDPFMGVAYFFFFVFGVFAAVEGFPFLEILASLSRGSRNR